MTSRAPLRIYFVVGEESGDALGEKLIKAFGELNQLIEPMGLGGERMKALGVKSLFDTSELAVMGISGVAAKLPGLLRRISQTADDVIKRNPDVLVLIDSPEFSYRVARKVRKKRPNIKIVKYVAPSVWAWRPGRAQKIKPYVDHIMAILPFEPDLMRELGGPDATYVGHPLAAEMPKVSSRAKKKCSDPVHLLVLPGSRRSETKLLLPVIRETLRILAQRGNKFEVTLPAVKRLEADIRQEVKTWEVVPMVVSGEDAKIEAFKNADLALTASGTATLELAIYRVPMISIYKLDRLMMQIRHLITAWTTALPNLIADYPVVPERLNENTHPQHLARMLERLMMDGEERAIQLKGFEVVRQKLAQETNGAQTAAGKIIEITRT